MIRRAFPAGLPVVGPLEGGYAFESVLGRGRERFVLRTEVRVAGPVRGEPPPDAVLPVALLPAMRRGRTLKAPPLASVRLAQALPGIQEQLAAFFPRLRPVRVRTPARGASPPAYAHPRGEGIFFSLGVDSFHAARVEVRQADTLVLVHGFDIPLAEEGLFARVERGAAEVAGALGKRLVTVRTNARVLLDRHLPWEHGQGAAMGHVAIVLTPLLERLVVASSHHHSTLFPFGSHPDLDPRWGTEWQAIEHRGTHLRRIDKIEALATDEVAMRHLRVCWTNPDGAWNCGRCAKCLIAMSALDALGHLARCATLPHTLEPAAFGAVATWSRSSRLFLAEVRDRLRRDRPDHPALPAIEEVLARPA